MTAERLKETALRFFAEKGYDGTSMADIAGEIGIKKPSIYAHFPSKSDLFLAVVEEAMADCRRCWREAFDSSDGLPADQALQQLFSEVCRHFIENRTAMIFWVRLWMFPPKDCPADLRASLREMHAAFIDEVSRRCRLGMEQGVFRCGNPDEFSHTLFSLLIGFLMRAVINDDLRQPELIRQSWETITEGIRVRLVQPLPEIRHERKDESND